MFESVECPATVNYPESLSWWNFTVATQLVDDSRWSVTVARTDAPYAWGFQLAFECRGWYTPRYQTEAGAMQYCQSLGSEWSVALSNPREGSLYCLRSGTAVSDRYSSCATFRIVVWKDGGGDFAASPKGVRCPFDTVAGGVYGGQEFDASSVLTGIILFHIISLHSTSFQII
jgi:hypothetical protein